LHYSKTIPVWFALSISITSVGGDQSGRAPETLLAVASENPKKGR
jgi:hypothetical protein